MEEHGYAFSYTQYGIIDKDSQDRGYVIGGKDMLCDAQAQYQDYSNLSECPMLQKEV